MRIPEWVGPSEVECTVNERSIVPRYEGRYALVGELSVGDTVTLRFPIFEETKTVIIEKHKYRITKRGNEVVKIDPEGVNSPLYQRAYYRNGTTLWKHVKRFTPATEIAWC